MKLLSWILCITVVVALLLCLVFGLFSQTGESLPKVTPQSLAEMMHSGVKITFIDTREPEEFAESHIPGAINIPIRKVTKQNVAALIFKLKSSKYVVAYCMKDFRGLEVSKKLSMFGATNVVFMDPPGLANWKKEKLPVWTPNKAQNN